MLRFEDKSLPEPRVTDHQISNSLGTMVRRLGNVRTMDEYSDELARARQGDRSALDHLLRRIQRRLRKQTEARLGDRLRQHVQSSDILQSTYLEVLKGLSAFEGENEEAFAAWVSRILENHIRRRGRFFAARKRRAPSDPAALPEALTPRSSRTPSSEVTRAEDLVLVSAALDRLSPEFRDVILLRVVDGLNHEEIADRMAKPRTATRMLLSRARAALTLEIERLERGE